LRSFNNRINEDTKIPPKYETKDFFFLPPQKMLHEEEEEKKLVW